MSNLALRILLGVGTAGLVTSLLWAVIGLRRPAPGRVRPWIQPARVRLGHRADPLPPPVVTKAHPLTTLGRVLAVPFRGRDETSLTRRVAQAGLYPGLGAAERVSAHRLRFGAAGAGGLILGGVVGLFLYGPTGLLVGLPLGGITAVTGIEARVDQAIRARSVQLRAELASLNFRLAIRALAGGSITDLLTYINDHGRGEASAELRQVWEHHQSGAPLTEALTHAAEQTPEPQAAHTYRLLSTAQRTGGDIHQELLTHSVNLDHTRLTEIATASAKRTTTTVIPLALAGLFPILALFIGPLIAFFADLT